MLTKIAQKTGGEYFHADPKRFGVEEVERALAGLKRSENEARVVKQYDEVYEMLLLPAFLLLVGEACMSERRRARQRGLAAPRRRRPREPRASVRRLACWRSVRCWSAFEPLRSRNGEVEQGNALMKAGKAEEALGHYDKAVAELPADPGAHFDRGAALFALSRFDEAGQEFLRATEAKDGALKASAFYNLGNAFFKKDKFKEAVEAYKRALALDPRDERAKWNLEIALRKQKEEEKNKDKDKKDDKNKKDKKDKDKNEDKKDDKKDQDKKDDKKDRQGAGQQTSRKNSPTRSRPPSNRAGRRAGDRRRPRQPRAQPQGPREGAGAPARGSPPPARAGLVEAPSKMRQAGRPRSGSGWSPPRSRRSRAAAPRRSDRRSSRARSRGRRARRALRLRGDADRRQQRRGRRLSPAGLSRDCACCRRRSSRAARRRCRSAAARRRCRTTSAGASRSWSRRAPRARS